MINFITVQTWQRQGYDVNVTWLLAEGVHSWQEEQVDIWPGRISAHIQPKTAGNETRYFVNSEKQNVPQ